MKSYLDILRNILDNGHEKYPTRTLGNVGQVDGSTKTLMLPNVHFEHDMSQGYPLLTTKKMAFKTMCVELEGFIQGNTNKQWYKDRGCNIWNGWANPDLVNTFRDKNGDELSKEDKIELQYKLNDLGPIYGAQWRDFNRQGYDQLKYIVSTLKTNPYDRRMVCSAWNPNQFDEMALIPCHTSFNITVYKDIINLFWMQRSVDGLLGAPFNIASYALLLILLAKEANLKPGLLSAMFVDCHLYENQIEVTSEQLKRTPYELPTIRIPDQLKSGKPFSIFDWTHEDIELIDYKCHPQLKCEVIV